MKEEGMRDWLVDLTFKRNITHRLENACII